MFTAKIQRLRASSKTAKNKKEECYNMLRDYVVQNKETSPNPRRENPRRK